MSATTASPRRVAAGRINAAKRWADPATRRTVRLDDLTVEQRAVVLALVAAVRKPADDAA